MMTAENPVQQLLARFKLPARDVVNLSFCSSNRPSAVKSWAESLPAIQINHSSVLLYKALPEIVRLKTSAHNRLKMLEAIRPYVQQCIQGLAAHFLNQPLILPDAPLKSAVIAQALQRHMTRGYCAVLVELASRGKKAKLVEADLNLACHRGITGFGLMLLRSYQLYSQVPESLWLQLHSLYWLAEYYATVDQQVAEPLLRQSTSCSTAQAYSRILLLACARPNQMRQTDVSATYEVLEGWCQLTTIRPADQQKPSNLFLVNLSADLAPLYKTHFADGSKDELRELDMSPLLGAFRNQRHARGGATGGIGIPHTISPALVDHLERAWGTSQQRSFERHPSMESIEVCVGLSNLHRRTAGGMSFEEFLGSALDLAKEKKMVEIDFGAIANDAWASGIGESNSGQQPEHPLFTVNIVDSSPGGYCLEWRDDIPPQVKAGEVLGLRERGRYRWGVGVIRWVQQYDTIRIGVQLLAPKATPFAAAIEQGPGASDYRRVLMLPELKMANQPATLLTAFAPFQENHRVALNSHGKISIVQLGSRIFSTGSVSQFTFRSLETVVPEPSEADRGSAWEE